MGGSTWRCAVLRAPWLQDASCRRAPEPERPGGGMASTVTGTTVRASQPSLTPAESAAMDRALEVARRGPVQGPNPRVGCVLLDVDGTVLGEGWHQGAGTAHAEVAALADAAARGAD